MSGLLVLLALLGPAWAEDPPMSPPPPVPEELPVIEGPQILEYVEAPYPAEALEQKLEGTVKVQITLSEAGLVEDIEVTGPAGHGFDEAAVDAILAMKFSPARTEAGPVGVVFEFAYSFALKIEEPPVEVVLPVNVEGIVQEMGTRKPIEAVVVQVDGTEITGTTDADGKFALRGAPEGQIKLKFLHPGHVAAATNLDIEPGKVTSAKFWMRADSYRENETLGLYSKVKEEVTKRTITIEEVKRIPGTFGDPVKIIQSLPGAARAPFGTGLLVIRGSNPEDSGVYIDGIRVPLIFHLTGTTSVLSPDIIQSVDYLPGGYGVNFGRTMGGTIDVKTRTEFSEQPKLTWGTDILDSQVYFEGSLGKNKQHGLAIGARRSYIDVFIPLFTKNATFNLKPWYWDFQVKWAPKLQNDQKFSVFVYGFQDVLEISSDPDVARGSNLNTQGAFRTMYLSQRVVAAYEKKFSDRLIFKLSPSIGYDGGQFGVANSFSLKNRTLINQIRAEIAWKPIDQVELAAGTDWIGGPWGFDFYSPLTVVDLDDPLAEPEPVGFDGKGTAISPDTWIKANIRPFKDPERLLITPGVRFSTLIGLQGGGVNGDAAVPPYVQGGIDPRIAVRAKVFEGGFVKGASGIYRQPPQPFQFVGLGGVSTTQFERSWDTTVGFEHQVSPVVFWDIDLFYKDLRNLITTRSAFSNGEGGNPFDNEGRGRAYGAEIILRHAPANRFFGWISYTLSRSERRDAPDEPYVPFSYDQTHIFSAQGGYDLPYDIGVSVQVQAVTGNPTSVANAGVYDADGDFYNGFRVGDENAGRLPPFVQTSFRVDKLWTFKRWQLETYVDFINAIKGVNPEFTVYNYDFSEFAYIRGLPFIPNVGVEAKFWL